MSLLADAIIERFTAEYTVLETLDDTAFITTVILPTGIVVEERTELTGNFAHHLRLSIPTLIEKIELTTRYENALRAQQNASRELDRITRSAMYTNVIENVENQR